VIVLFGLCLGMRSHRKIGLKSIMGRGRGGYGNGKSRRERLGIKKGAIRLEDREIIPESEVYRDDDEIRPAPLQTRTATQPRFEALPRVGEVPQLKEEAPAGGFPAPPSGHNFYSASVLPSANKTTKPSAPSHQRDLSLGSLVADDDSNSFRREVMKQQREKQ
jgi:hypothetical protein